MTTSVGLYNDQYVFEPFGHKLRTNMNTNAQKTVLIELV